MSSRKKSQSGRESRGYRDDGANPPKKRRGSFLYALFFLIFAAAAVSIVVSAAENDAELKRLQREIAANEERERLLELENEQLRRYAAGENFDEYLERYARDVMGYANPHERVYGIISGAGN